MVQKFLEGGAGDAAFYINDHFTIMQRHGSAQIKCQEAPFFKKVSTAKSFKDIKLLAMMIRSFLDIFRSLTTFGKISTIKAISNLYFRRIYEDSDCE